MEINEISGLILESAFKVHTALGPGLLESAYEACLAHELRKRGLKVLRQVECPIQYDGETVDCGYRLDLLVESEVVVEIKAVERMIPLFDAQVISYLRFSEKKVGLLINFHELRLKNGIKRFANGIK